MNDLTVPKAQMFFTAREVADIAKERGLTTFPSTERGVQKYAATNGWNEMGVGYCRKRAGRGGGWEYHFTLMPDCLRLALEGKAIRQAAQMRVVTEHQEEMQARRQVLSARRKARR